MNQDEQRDQEYREITEHAKAVFGTPFAHLIHRYDGANEYWSILTEMVMDHNGEVVAYLVAAAAGNMLFAKIPVITAVSTELWKNRDAVKHLLPLVRGLKKPGMWDGWHEWLVDNDQAFLAAMR